MTPPEVTICEVTELDVRTCGHCTRRLREPLDFVEISAAYAGRCPSCGRRWDVGEQIVKATDLPWCCSRRCVEAAS